MFFKQKKVGLYLIHGFNDTGDSIYGEFISLINRRTTFKAVAKNLQGHNCSDELNTFDYKQCIHDVEGDYAEFKRDFDEVYIIGFSMGGVIASHLASKFGCEKLVLLAPAFKYIESTNLGKDFFEIIREEIKTSSFADLFKPKIMDSIGEIIEKKYKDEAVVFKKYLKGKVAPSLRAYLNFMLLVDKLDNEIEIKDTPVRIYIGEHDELVPIKSALHIYNQIESKNKRLIILPHVYHDLMNSTLREDLSKEIIRFLRSKK